MNRRTLVAALLLFLGTVAQPALGQVDVVAVDPDFLGTTTSWSRVGFHHMFEADLDGSGDVQRDSVTAWIGHRFDVHQDFRILTQFMYNAALYDFDRTGGTLDWNDIHTATLAALGGWSVADRWTLLAGGFVKSQGESGASFEDMVNGGGLLGFLYAPRPNLRVGLLVGGLKPLENDAAVIPLPLAKWRFAEDWHFDLGPILLDYLGYGGQIGWKMSERWDASAGATYTFRRFRLDGGDVNEDGIGEDSSAPLFVRVGYHPAENIDLNLFATLQVAGEMRVESRTGNKIVERDYDPAPGLGVRAHFRF